MTDGALKSLSLTAFRGSSGTFDLRFEAGRKLTLIYGENGTGKTTICDGFEFLAKGDVGSLQDKGMGKSLEKYWPSAGKALTDIHVVLERQDGSLCEGRFEGKQPIFKPAATRPVIELLRRRQITDLIETQPAERYKALKRFIDVEGVEISEDALRAQLRQVDVDRTNAEREELASYTSLKDLFESAGKIGEESPLQWAEAFVSEPQGDASEELRAVEMLVAVVTALAAYPELYVQTLAAVAEAQGKFDAANAAAESAVAQAGGNAAETVQLLEAGKTFLHAHPNAGVCPLCESPDKAEGLANAVEARLNELAAVQEAQSAMLKARAALVSARANLADLESKHTATLADYASARTAYPWGASYSFPADPPSTMANLGPWLSSVESAAESWKLAEAELRSGSQQREAVKRALDRFRASKNNKDAADAAKPNLDKALEICATTRRAFTDKVMGEIAEEVGKLYEEVHPGEGLEKIALALDPKKRASIEIAAKFAGVDVPPTAYFSQSHLDTLGLCVFLALAVRDKADEKILILDDVLGSVDDPHVDRVISMLYSVASRFRHAIITTHYRPWREKFRWGRLKPDQSCQFVELTGWALAGGMRTRNMLPEVRRLRNLLDDPEPDLQSIVGKAGVILEEALDFLTLQYGCSVPRRHGGSYTLGDLLPSISNKLRSALKVEVIQKTETGETVTNVDLKPMLDALQEIAQTRNILGAHFNVLSYDVLEGDALAFGEGVLGLSEALVCPEYGWPSRDKSGTYWDNSGGTRRLYPLKKPA